MRKVSGYPDEPENQREDDYQSPCVVEPPLYRIWLAGWPPYPRGRQIFRHGRKDERDGESQHDIAEEGGACIHVVDGPEPVAELSLIIQEDPCILEGEGR